MTSKDRQLLYQEPNVQLLLNRFLKGEIMELVPQFDPTQTVRYPEVETVVEGDESAARQLTERLWDAGILNRKFFEKVLVCPSCLSANVSNDYVCPNCNSIDIERKTLLEHSACGTIESVDNFLVQGSLVCPKCNRELMEAGIDYQKLGSWFQCKQCNKRSDVPSPIHRCRSCGHIFTIRDTGFVNIYSYRLSLEAEEEFKRGYVLMRPIGSAFEEFEFKVEMPGQVVGRSGVLQRFDAVATKSSGEVVVVDLIASERAVDEIPVASLYAKIFDVSPTQAILIAIPGITEKGRRLASLYRMGVIEASNSEVAAELLKEKLGWTGLQAHDEQTTGLEL